MTTTQDEPARIGPYRLLERLGEGGMGEVHRALDTMLEREVALKMLRPAMSARTDLLERFRVEAIALARLHHRHIATVYAFFEHGGQHYMALQFVRGRTLEAVLHERGRLPWPEAAAIAMDVLAALEHAHALGVVHRDLKPANLMIDDEGRAVVMDFGIARVLERGRQTREGTLVGTLEYIAPEIVKGAAADGRADLYALGCVLYEMVTGELPFSAPSDFALMRAHAEQAPPRPTQRASALPAAAEALILRAMAKRPQDRFDSAAAFRAAIADSLGAAAGATPPAPASRDAAHAPRPLSRSRPSWPRGLRAPAWATNLREWLALPAARDTAAWKGWARANPGLAGAALVGLCAVLLVTAHAGWRALPAPSSPLPPAVAKAASPAGAEAIAVAGLRPGATPPASGAGTAPAPGSVRVHGPVVPDGAPVAGGDARASGAAPDATAVPPAPAPAAPPAATPPVGRALPPTAADRPPLPDPTARRPVGGSDTVARAQPTPPRPGGEGQARRPGVPNPGTGTGTGGWTVRR